MPRIVSAVMPGKQGLDGKDISIFDNLDCLEVSIHSDFSECMSVCDTWIIPDGGSRQESDLFAKMKKVICANKNIICMQELTEDELKILLELSKNKGAYFKYNVQEYKKQEFCYIPDKLCRHRTPIVMVGEMFEGLGGVDVTLHINSFLKEKGYRSIAILENVYLEGLDVFSYPKFLRKNECLESDKIYFLNNYVKYLEKEEKPDVMVMKIPDAMLKYNDSLCMGFGVIPFLITQAVRADFFVLCTQFAEANTQFYDMMNKGFEGRYGVEIDCIHISNVMLDLEDSIQKNKVSVLRRMQKDVDGLIERKYTNTTIPILNCRKRDGMDMLGNCIIEKLSGYGRELGMF